ncbi:MAG: hypothetical protein ABJQ39_12800 [Winogradskyella arenosi]
MTKFYGILILIGLLLVSCAKDDGLTALDTESVVHYDLENMPFSTLSEYRFFQGELKNLEPSHGVLPYTLNATLFSDYAKKKRFIWMPNQSKAAYVSDDQVLDFPTGTILIKNFYYDNVRPDYSTQIIETRLMIKKEAGWVFANYKWNALQSEAELDLNGSFVPLEWEENDEVKSVEYRIPSEAECHTCHKIMETAQPIGPKPRNLNLTFQADEGLQNQLDYLVEFGYLDNSLPETIYQLPNYTDTSVPLSQRVRSYLEINCAHCHSDYTHCSYRPMRFDYSLTDDFANMGVCVDADTPLGEDLERIVTPGDARSSVLYYRLSATEPSTRMPLLARTLVHTEGLQLVEAWIESLDMNCN